MSYLSSEEAPEIESHREACENAPYEIDTREWTLNGFRQYISGPQLDGTEVVVVIPKSRLATHEHGGGKDHTPPPTHLAT